MNIARIKSCCRKICEMMLSLIRPALKALSERPKMTALAAAILLLVLILALTTCSHKEPLDELTDATLDTQIQETESMIDPEPLETQPVGIPATMGTVTTDNLSICKDAGIVIDIEEYYNTGDRVEIHETKNVNGTIWGYTGKGWIAMRSVRMDDVPPSGEDAANSEGTQIVSNGSYAVLGYGVVDLKTLNVRVGPGTDYTKIKEVSHGTRYAYYEVYDEWVRIGDGWVSTEHFYVEGTTAKDATAGTVTTNNLNVRTGPDTSFMGVNSYMEGDAVQILAVVGGWGYTEEGWISMMYVELPGPVYATGSATVTVGLNIREEPNADSAIVDTYKEGDSVTILEVIDSWGRTDKGWIKLDFVKYD